jgi:hypothetical protein
VINRPRANTPPSRPKPASLTAEPARHGPVRPTNGPDGPSGARRRARPLRWLRLALVTLRATDERVVAVALEWGAGRMIDPRTRMVEPNPQNTVNATPCSPVRRLRVKSGPEGHPSSSMGLGAYQ